MKRRTVLVLAIVGAISSLFICSHRASANVVQWSVSDGGNDHFYEAVLVPQGIDWHEANAAATKAGGYLATINSSTENSFVFNLVSNNPDFWICVPHSSGSGFIYGEGPWLGGYHQGGTWHWITGEPFTYTNWAPYEPSGRPGEDALQFFGYGTLIDSKWNNQPPGDPMKGYIVESLVPVPSAFILGSIGVGLVTWLRRRKTL